MRALLFEVLVEASLISNSTILLWAASSSAAFSFSRFSFSEEKKQQQQKNRIGEKCDWTKHYGVNSEFKPTKG